VALKIPHGSCSFLSILKGYLLLKDDIFQYISDLSPEQSLAAPLGCCGDSDDYLQGIGEIEVHQRPQRPSRSARRTRRNNLWAPMADNKQ